MARWTLRRRTRLLVVLLLLGTALATYWLGAGIIDDGYRSLERDLAGADAARAQAALGAELRGLQGVASDYANGDDTYAYAAGDLPDFRDDYVTVEVIAPLNASFLALVDQDGRDLGSIAIDAATGAQGATSAALAAAIGTDGILTPRDGDVAASGVARLGDEVFLFASHRILTSEGHGPARGTLVFGRALDASMLDHLTDSLQTKVTLVPADREVAPMAMSDDTIVVSSALIDPAGEIIGALELSGPRDVWQQGERAKRLLLWALLGTGVVSAGIAFPVSDKLLLRRVDRLESEVDRVTADPGSGSRVRLAGEDEVGHLAAGINQMLDAVAEVHELRTTNAQLQETHRVKDEILSVVSHEFRTPLTVIHGCAEILQRRGQGIDAALREDFIDRIVVHAKSMTRMVDELLILSSIQAGTITPQPDELVARDFAAALVADRGGAREISVTGDDAAVLVDADHLRRILTNYLDNAVKYGLAPVSVEIDRTGDEVVIAVRDHGEGVPTEFVPQLFDRFTQASAGTRRTAKGIGLGLSIVARLAAANGGAVAYDRTGNHSVFSVRLPAVAALADRVLVSRSRA